MAVRAWLAAALILALFALTGGAIFSIFGITLPAFQIAGGILFTIMGLTTLRSDDPATERSRGRRDAGPVDRPPRHAPHRRARRHLDRHGARRPGT